MTRLATSEILDRGEKKGWIITEAPKPGVAEVAENPAHRARFVTVIDGEVLVPLAPRRRCPANRTATALGGQKLIVFLDRDPIRLPKFHRAIRERSLGSLLRRQPFSIAALALRAVCTVTHPAEAFPVWPSPLVLRRAPECEFLDRLALFAPRADLLGGGRFRQRRRDLRPVRWRHLLPPLRHCRDTNRNAGCKGISRHVTAKAEGR